MGVVAYANRKMKPKFSNKGGTCIFVGYATNHAGDVYRMLDMNTQKVTISKDVRWLNKSYKEQANGADADTKEIEEDDGYETAEKFIQKKTKSRVPTGVERELQVNTHEEIEDVETRAACPRTLRSGRETGKVTLGIGDLHIALLMPSLEPDNVEE